MFQKFKQKYKILKQSFISINWNNTWEEEYEYLKYLIKKRQDYPLNPIYDTLFQFKAQSYKSKAFSIIVLNFISFFGFLYLIGKFFFKRKIIVTQNYDVAYFYNLDIFNINIRNNKKFILVSKDEGYLKLKDVMFLFRLAFLFKFNFIIVSTVCFRLAQIVYARKKFNIKEIWTNAEYSCSSGVIKHYCNKKNIKFNNFMHGEKILTLRDAFSSFNSFYVWDEHYIDLFRKLHTSADLKISNPWKNLKVNRENVMKGSICYILKGLETEEEITKIKYLFDYLNKNGYKIYVKDHPRQHKTSKEFINVEIIKDSDIFDCFEKYEIIVAQYSTVLIQCNYLNIPSYIDDFSNEELYKNLLERGYLNRNQTIKNLLSIL